MPPAARLVVTEGNYLLLDEPSWRAARARLDETWLVTTDPAVRIARLVVRHIEFGKPPDAAREWVLTVDEGNARQIERTAAAADLVVENMADGWRVTEP